MGRHPDWSPIQDHTRHPDEITYEQVLAALKALGLDPGDVFDVVIEPHTVTVTYTLRASDGTRHKPEHQSSLPRLIRTYNTDRDRDV